MFLAMRYLIAFLFAGTCFAAAQTNELEAPPTLPAWFARRVDADTTVYALAVVFALTFLLTFYVGVLYFRERRRLKAARFAPQNNLALAPVARPNSEVLTVAEWKDRALSAETLANNQALLLRERLLPELTEFVKQSLVQGLAAQRDALLAMQQQAMQNLVEMESRLAALQTPLQDRIRAYESRIGELEKELIAQGAEMRELTRTILELMRKKLEEERVETTAPESFN